MIQKDAKKCKKMQRKFICEKCDFITCNKYNFKKHCETRKHNDTQMIHNDTKKMYICECGKNI